MADKLNIDKEKVEENASTIASAAGYFTPAVLTPFDSRTTITANEKSQTAFSKAQSGIGAFGTALDKDVANIRSLNVSFQEFDEMMGELSASGFRTPVITAPK